MSFQNKEISWELRARVDREIKPGERVQWMESPIPRFFNMRSMTEFLFAIPWTAFALFWMAGASGMLFPAEDADSCGVPGTFNLLFPLFGVPFVLIGFWMLSSPLRARRRAGRSVYVVTDRRAIIFEGGRSFTIRSYEASQLGNVYRREKRDGSGDVVITKDHQRNSHGNLVTNEIGFLNIQNPSMVEDMLKKLAASTRGA